MPMLIDTHAHLYYDNFKPDFNEVIRRTKDAGVTTVINIGADLESSKKAVELESSQVKFYSTIGIHPHEVLRLTQDKQPISESIHKHIGLLASQDPVFSFHSKIEKLEELYQSHPGKVVAVGECGLDYFFSGVDYSPSLLPEGKQKELQKILFASQISLAKRLNVPIIIHCRDSWNDIFLPELHEASGVFHSFTGSPEVAQKVLDMGYYLGLTCPITYPKNEYLRQIIKESPLEMLLTETDCPFLPPQSMRGQRNEPANVTEVVKVIAEVKGISFDEAAAVTYKNAQKLFSVV